MDRGIVLDQTQKYQEAKEKTSMSDNLLQVIQDDAKTAKLPQGLSEADIKRMYEGMVMVRAYDERQKNLQRSGRIGFCVTSTGEEAVQIGTAAALEPTDWIYPYYRQYGMLMFRGASLDVLANHLFGNVTDLAKGRQMPAHYTDKATNFVSFSSVIGTHLTHAVGTAMAAQYKEDDIVVATYIGDGGTSSNDFHAALTFAGVRKAPVVFFIVNNQYAISLPVEKQCATKSLHLKGEGYGIPALRVDGNDIIAVYQASQEAYARARRGEGPTLVELLTYRAGPHSSSDDPSRYRSQEEMDEWAAKDPLERCKRFMQQLGIWTESYETKLWEDIREKMVSFTNIAEKGEEPSWESMFDDVYSEIPDALRRQRDELIANESEFPRDNEGEFPL